MLVDTFIGLQYLFCYFYFCYGTFKRLAINFCLLLFIVLVVMSTQRNRNLFVDVLITTFGSSTWIGITGIYLQLPQFIQTAPEGANLSSHIGLLVQSGNFVTLVYLLTAKWCAPKIVIDNVLLIYLTIGIGCLAAVCMVFFGSNTMTWGGKPRSIPLFLCTFLFSVVGCFSAVIFLPYMARFRQIYLLTYLFGRSIGSFISSILALVQGVGTIQCINNNTVQYSEPLFQPRSYFVFVFCMLVLSLIAFVLLNKLRVCKNETEQSPNIQPNETASIANANCNNPCNGYQSITTDAVNHSAAIRLKYLLCLLGVVSFLVFGFLPGIEPFSCAPYGPRTYHLAVVCTSIVSPVVFVLGWNVRRPSILTITILFGLSIVLASYIFLIAVESPTPPFVTSRFGMYLIVIIYCFYVVL